LVFKGWQRTSLIEYPDRISTVLFTGGCNLRCPFCYNAELVLHPEAIPDLPEDTVLDYLRANRRLYQAVMVTGGEPTLAAELPEFFTRVKSLGLLAGLETNGTNPAMLETLLGDQKVDFVALDLKAPLSWADYRRAAGLPAAQREILALVRRSVELLRASAVEQELRLTVVPGLHEERQFTTLARQLAGVRRVVLQQFVPGKTLDPELGRGRPLPLSGLQRLAALLAPRVGSVEIRGA
jgi:pyruvate formate lyase activating enzyme